MHPEKTDPPSKNRVGGFEVVTCSCTEAICPQGLELHQETYSATTTTVSGVVEWLSNDPIGINGGLNQYVAFANNPVMFVDPWGLCAEGDFKIELAEQDLINELKRYYIKKLVEYAPNSFVGINRCFVRRAYDADIDRFHQRQDGPNVTYVYQGDEYHPYEVNYIAVGAFFRHVGVPEITAELYVLLHNMVENRERPTSGKRHFRRIGRDLYSAVQHIKVFRNP